ncbi:hypothetical protein MMC08_002564 [Hypocenomyce scalaris]|nr:hypothetical protein [Hypocenomyce scalaris]
MPQINDYSDFTEFKTAGLYTITNQSSGTVLDLYGGSAEAGTAIIGYAEHDGDNQMWQIADVGDSKWVIICKKTGSYVRATGDGTPVVAGVGYPDNKSVHWKIQKHEANHPEITHFHSVSQQGDVLELKDGSEVSGTQVQAYAQNAARNGQKWLLKKINV